MSRKFGVWVLLSIYSVCLPLMGNSKLPDPAKDSLQFYIHHAEKALEEDLDSAHYYLTQAHNLSKELGTFLQQGRVLYLSGLEASYLGNYEEAEHFLDQAMDKFPPGSSDEHHEVLIALHRELGEVHYYLGNSTESLKHFNQVIALSQVKQDPQYLYLGLNGKAKVLNRQRQYREAMNPLILALQTSRSLSDTSLQIEVLNQLATNHFSMGNYDSAQQYFTYLLGLKRDTENQRAIISDLTQIGNMFSDKQGEYHLAQAYYLEALELAEELSDSMLMVSTLTDMGKAFVLQENWNKALEYARRGLAVAEDHGLGRWIADNHRSMGEAYAGQGEKNHAVEHLEAALAYHESELQDITQIAGLRLRLGSLLGQNADYEASLTYLQEAYSAKQQVLDKAGMMEAQLLMASIFLKQSQITKALKSLTISLQLSDSLNSKNGKGQSYKLLAEAHESRGNFRQAYQYHRLFTNYRDSLFQEERDRYINEQEEKYQAEQKDRENAELQAAITQSKLEDNIQNQLLESRRQQVYLLFGSLGVLALFLAFLWYSYNKRQQLLQQKLITLQKEQETENLRFMISGEEKERLRIARELHDGIGSLLASVKVLFSAVQNDSPEIHTSQSYVKADKMLDKACQEVRDISHNLMPSLLDQYGLEYAIQEEVHLFRETHKLDISFISHVLDQELDYNIQASVYRIVQEMLRNIVKHAEATEVIVQLIVEDHVLQLTVEDNGKGFDKTQTKSQRGIGLDSMHSRVVYLQGSMTVDTEPGSGCSILVEIPV